MTVEPWRTVETVVRKKWLTHLPHFPCNHDGIKRNFFKTVWLGFVQSCEFLKKSWNLSNNFPDLEKVWKMVKSLEFFFLQLYKWNLFCFCQILFNLTLTFCVKKLCSCIFKVCIDHLFDNRESGKINYCFGKKSWILDPKMCTNHVWQKWPFLFLFLSQRIIIFSQTNPPIKREVNKILLARLLNWS